MSALKGYRSTLTSAFKYRIPGLQDSFVLSDLISSCELERPLQPIGPPSWDLIKVLEYLLGPVFEPLPSKPLHIVTIKGLFLLSLATAKRVGELQALYFQVAFNGPDLKVYLVYRELCHLVQYTCPIVLPLISGL